MKTAFSYIRFSSKPQERGDSLRRQVRLARDYATKHDLILDERSYQDLGISAFKGKNAIEGALAAFLKAVDDKVIPRGAFLLVESLDRVSRDEVMEALETFMSIVKRGIVLVTLNDEQVYTRESIKENWTKLIMALAVMARSNDESASKSKRIKAAWQGKRDDGVIMTAMGPAWLELNEARTKFRLIPDKVAVVKKVFDLAASGLGAPTIASKLNDAGVQTMGKAEFWEAGIVAAMLRNQAVIGRLVSRKASTPPRDNYYPAIIKPEVFHTVQEHINGRAANRGKTGTNVANLFSGIARCECGSRMRFVSGAKPHLYLRCVKAYSNAGCDAPTIPYNTVEEEIMQMILVWSKLPLDATKVEDPTVVLNGELDEKRRQQANIMKVINSASDMAAPKLLLSNLARLEDEIESLEKQLRTATVPAPVSQAVKEATLLWKAHGAAKGDDLRDLRLRLQSECKRMLTKVVFCKEIRQSPHSDDKPNEYSDFILYGPVVDANPFESAPMFTPDGGWKEEYRRPAWGINGTRRRVKAAA